MQHRLVERGQDSPRIMRLATICAAWALVPVSIALASDLFVAMRQIVDPLAAAAVSLGLFVLAILSWYAVAYFLRRPRPAMPDKVPPTPIEVQVDQLLTEARVIIPGVQALLGFQLTVTMTSVFAQLPPESKFAHAVALCCIGLAVVLVMAPASIHRLAFAGQDDAAFLPIGSALVVAAGVPLALGITLDSYVAIAQALGSTRLAMALAAVALILLLGMWYLYPLWRRQAKRGRAPGQPTSGQPW
jgi:hypothetical protein